MAFIPFVAYLPWIKAISNQMKVFHSTTWQLTPNIIQLMKLPYIFLGPLAFVLLLYSFIYLLNHKTCLVNIYATAKKKSDIIFLSIAFSLLPFVIGIISLLGVVPYVERYFVISIPWIIFLISKIFANINFNKIVLSGFIFIAAILFFINQQKNYLINQEYNTTLKHRMSLVRKNKIVVCESPHIYYPLYFYLESKYRNKLFLVVDKVSSFEKESVKNALFDFYWNLNIKKYYTNFNIMKIEDFNLIAPVNFLIINEKGRLLFERYFMNDNYKYSLIESNIYKIGQLKK